jgi:TPP-dependent pyruvate/acetoin dehydrogenase alpha subunit
MIKSPYKLKKNYKKFLKKNNNFLVKVYKNLYLCRYTEEFIREVYPEKNMKTPTHLGIGQEAIAVGVCLNLKNNDNVYCHHRSHLPFIALEGNIYKLFCELMGKKNGTSGGKGGSVHLCLKGKINYNSTAILGQSMALAVGAGLAHKLKKKKNISVSFFGNASLEEGISYEVLNFSSLKNIPTLFVYENNFYSTEMPNYKGYLKKINYKKIINSLGIKYLKVDGNNIAEVYTATQKAINYIREKSKPVFIEFITYRWLEHCGPYYDHELGRNYRDKKEVLIWQNACPVKNFKNYIKKNINIKKITTLENKIKKIVKMNYFKSLKSQSPTKFDLLKNV